MSSRLDVLWIHQPAPEISPIVAERSGCNRQSATEVGKVRSGLPLRSRPLNRVTVSTRVLHEYLPAPLSGRVRWIRCGLKLTRHPCLKLGFRFSDYPQGHMGMLQTAEFRALASVLSRNSAVCN